MSRKAAVVAIATVNASFDDIHAAARPVWADIDLTAISRNIAVVRERVRRPVRIIAPVKANAYGHGMVAVSRYLQTAGVDGLATANVDDAIAARAAGVSLPILLYGAQLPAGNTILIEHAITPSVYSGDGLQALTALAAAAGRRLAVHIKVDAGLGRLGVRLDEAAAFAREVLARPGLELEGIYTHIPFSDEPGGDWSARRLAAFAGLVAGIEAEHGIRIPFAQAAASSVLSRSLPDPLNTISPGHLLYGLCPLNGERAESQGYARVLTALRARLIHIGERRVGDDLYGLGPDRSATNVHTGVILFGMDNGYRPAPVGRTATMLCHGVACPVLAVSAEYTVLDLSALPDAQIGDVVTVVGRDGDLSRAAEDVATDLGAPSAAYWLLALKSVPMRYAAV